MVRHSVFFWLVDSLTNEERAAFEEGLRALFEIDVVTKGSFGRPAATPERMVTRNTFDYSLALEFDSVDAHNAYQAHDDHSVFVKNFGAWFRKVRVYDIEF